MTAPRLAQANALAYCAKAVEHLLRTREAGNPQAVAKGKITAEVAEQTLEHMRAIAMQWRWVMDPANPPAPPSDHETGDFGFHNYLLAAEMDRVAARARAKAAKTPGDPRKAEMADICDALAWFQQDVAGSARIVMYISSVRRMRANVEASTTKAKAA